MSGIAVFNNASTGGKNERAWTFGRDCGCFASFYTLLYIEPHGVGGRGVACLAKSFSCFRCCFSFQDSGFVHFFWKLPV